MLRGVTTPVNRPQREAERVSCERDENDNATVRDAVGTVYNPSERPLMDAIVTAGADISAEEVRIQGLTDEERGQQQAYLVQLQSTFEVAQRAAGAPIINVPPHPLPYGVATSITTLAGLSVPTQLPCLFRS